MSLQKFISRPLKKLERRFGGRRKPGSSEVDIAGGVEPTDSRTPPESGVEVGDEYGQGGNEGGGDEGGVGSMGSPPQHDDSEATAEHERERELGLQSKIDVSGGESGLVDSLSQSVGEEGPGNGRSREGGEAVAEGGVGPVDSPPRSDIGIPGNQEPSGSTW